MEFAFYNIFFNSIYILTVDIGSLQFQTEAIINEFDIDEYNDKLAKIDDWLNDGELNYSDIWTPLGFL